MNLNYEIFYFLNNLAGKNETIDFLVLFFAQYLPYILVGIFVVFYFYRFYKSNFDKKIIKEFFIISFSAVLIWFVSQIINFFYYSPRPFIALDNINVLFEHGNGDSFPSGHTTFFTTLALMSYLYTKKWFATVLLIGAVLIGVARVIVGVHWPLDILGGFALSFVGFYIIRRFFLKKPR
ncbi:MAG: phosphatase PAP2 family protein [Candidatus Pacebacteria bacterium]|nr:phosphatase PAP2 family protein [Candidatus Paceibacterota bacterium]